MMVTHETTIQAKCPVDEGEDHYVVMFETQRIIKVEDISAAIEALTKSPVFQEQLTIDLARRLGARVTTVGYHSGFKTTVVAGQP